MLGLIVIVIASISITGSAPVYEDNPKPGCIIGNTFYKVGHIVTDQYCTEQCECLEGNGLCMPVCWPLCGRYPSDCPEGELVRHKLIPVGLPGSNCTCKEAECKIVEGGVSIEY